MGKHNKELSFANKLYKEERKENRLRNFMFRETRDVVMLVAFSMMALSNNSEDASDSTKALNKSLMDGFAAFMALDFAIKILSAGLGFATGGLATAITVLVGLGVGLHSFFTQSSKDAEELAKKAIDARKQLAELAKEALLSKEKLGAGTLAGEEAKLRRLKEEQIEAAFDFAPFSGTSAISTKEGITAYKRLQDARNAVKEQQKVVNEMLNKGAQEYKDNYFDKYLEEVERIYGIMDEEKRNRMEAMDGITEDAERVQSIMDEEAKKAEYMYNVQQEYMNGLANSLDVLAYGISMVSKGTDNALLKLIQGIQYAMKIITILSATGKAKEAQGGGLGSILGAFGNILGIISLFDRGGFTGEGGTYEPAGIVHKGEYVFSKRAVNAIGVGTMDSLHRRLTGYASGGLVNSGMVMPNVVVVLKNPITWGDGLKQHMPIYSRWDSKKRV
jgi:hypothetical protein